MDRRATHVAASPDDLYEEPKERGLPAGGAKGTNELPLLRLRRRVLGPGHAARLGKFRFQLQPKAEYEMGAAPVE